MFTIEVIKIQTEDIPIKKWNKAPEFKSPNGEFILKLSDPFDFAMGGVEWKLNLFRNNQNISNENTLLQQKRVCFCLYQPWSCDSSRIFLVDRNGRSEIYDLNDKKIIGVTLPFFPIHVLGGEYAPRYLVAGQHEALVTYLNGHILEKLDFYTVYPNFPTLHWFQNDRYFFIFGRESMDSFPQLVFFDTNTLKKVQTVELNPQIIIPFEREQYKAMTWLKKADSEVWVDKNFLDTWSNITFNIRNNVLELVICRPVSLPYKNGIHLECRVKDVLVEVKINEK
jgi:hypothetical protein